MLGRSLGQGRPSFPSGPGRCFFNGGRLVDAWQGVGVLIQAPLLPEQGRGSPKGVITVLADVTIKAEVRR